jgi:hypothetical protein
VNHHRGDHPGQFRIGHPAGAGDECGAGGGHRFLVLVGDQVLGDDDVGAAHLAERLQADFAVQPVPDLHRPMQNQLLIGVHHLAQVVADQDPHEQLLDRERYKDADERDRPQNHVAGSLSRAQLPFRANCAVPVFTPPGTGLPICLGQVPAGATEMRAKEADLLCETGGIDVAVTVPREGYSGEHE